MKLVDEVMPVIGNYHPVRWLDTRGWGKGALWNDDDGSVCAMGALKCMDGHTRMYRETSIGEMAKVRSALLETTGCNSDEFTGWLSIAEINDRRETTFQQVRDAFVKVFGDWI